MSGARIFLLLILGVGIGINPSKGQSDNSVNYSKEYVGKKIVKDVIIVKLKGDHFAQSDARVAIDSDHGLSDVLKQAGSSQYRQLFPPRTSENSRTSNAKVDLTGIYQINLPQGTDIWQTLKKLQDSGAVEYAEPLYQNLPLDIPLDPLAIDNSGQQNHLGQIKAYDAWEIETGDTTIVVGIVDTGVNYNHPDLKGNLALNYADPINGIDDDHDGYVDNYLGWDVGDNDKDPITVTNGHGSSVAGLSSAMTDNYIGIAGTGYKSRYLPIKAYAESSTSMINEYLGVVYAANHGCKVINLSWGGVEASSKFGQDVINYAVLDRDAVVIAAAGNTHDNLNFYPASFNNVLSVGATDDQDNLASWATYSYNIDMMAPGNNVLSTDNKDGYARELGSSFAAPQVSGAAALVRHHFPQLTAQQVMEQLRVTADDIYDVGSNGDYRGMLGKGRLNMYRALTDTVSPSIRIANIDHNGNFGTLIFPGDTVNIYSTFNNYLRKASNVNVALSSPDPTLQINSQDFNIGSIGTFASVNNNDHPFTFIVPRDAQPGQKMVFRLDFNNTNYDDFQYFEINTTPDAFEFAVDSTVLTIGSDGDMGFNYQDLHSGVGMKFKERVVANWLGLVIAKDAEHVSDNIISNFRTRTIDHDFQSIEYARLYNDTPADEEARSVFEENDSLSNRLGVKVEQKTLGWKNPDHDNFIIMEYRLTNMTDSSMTGLDVGLFADWDLNNFQHNAVEWDGEHAMGYTFDKDLGDLYAGMAILSGEGEPAFHAIDKEAFDGNTAEIQDVMDDAKKYEFLSNGLSKVDAGQAGGGNDVAQMIGLNGIALNAKQSKKAAFVFLLGNSKDELVQNLLAAQAKYNEYISNPHIDRVLFGCKGQTVTIQQDSLNGLEIYKDVQLTQLLDSGSAYTTPPVENEQTYYIVKTVNGYRSDVSRILVKTKDPIAKFKIPADTLYTDAGTPARLSITDQSTNTDSWYWDFGNKYGSTVQNPSTTYQTNGEYTINLIASNEYGCSDTVQHAVVVKYYAPLPDVTSDISICKGTYFEIAASNTTNIGVYADPALTAKIFSGEKYVSGPLYTSDTLYVVNQENGGKSKPAPVDISVNKPETGFTYHLDTLDIAGKYVLTVSNTAQHYTTLVWNADGEKIENTEDFNFEYGDKSAFTLTQITTNNEGCTDSLKRIIKPVASPKPVAENIVFCSGSSVTIEPKNGKVFYFYDDEQLEHLIRKGHNLTFNDLSTGSLIYITGMDSLLESDATPVSIKPTGLKADFTFSQDTINLANGSELRITNTSKGADWFYWLLASRSIDTDTVLIKQLQYPGNYSYELIAGDQYGCVDRILKSVLVLNVTALEDQLAKNIGLFPNPALDVVNIKDFKPSQAGQQYQIIDSSGKVVYEGITQSQANALISFNIASLTKGIYFIKIYNQDHLYFGKFLKQ